MLLFAIALAPACSRPKTGKYLGLEVRPTTDASGDTVMAFTDRALIELDDGSRIVVTCDMATARQIHSGTRVILVPQGQGWRVKPVSGQKPATRPPAAP